jgi:hypothetical protein
MRLGLPQKAQIALFMAGDRLKEIYGIDLLFNSWRKVKKKFPDVLLLVLGPTDQLGLSTAKVSDLRKKGVSIQGMVKHTNIPFWISAADLCLSQRTPGFPVQWYNIQDSLKLSEYALFEKPIVAAGYLPGPDYISAKTTVESYSKAIIKGLRGHAPRPTTHVWEENIPVLKKAYRSLHD